MKKPMSRGLATLVLVSGIAIACQSLPFPIPPMPLSVSALNVARAVASGVPAHMATTYVLYQQIDSHGANAIGSDKWVSNKFSGYVTYNSPLGGQAIAYFEKSCGKTMVGELGIEGIASTGGGGGDYAGGSGGGYGGSGPFDMCTSGTETIQSCSYSDKDGDLGCVSETVTVLDCPFGYG